MKKSQIIVLIIIACAAGIFIQYRIYRAGYNNGVRDALEQQNISAADDSQADSALQELNPPGADEAEAPDADNTSSGSDSAADQLINPSEEYVISCLEKISEITEIAAATEDNDPNGQLHKQGGYTSAVFFSLSLIDQSDVYGDGLIGKGTDAGGSIEVYETEEYAERRDSYLGAFDGSGFSSGSHTVFGTVVVRTSNELTATQQNEMEQKLIQALTEDLNG